MIQVHIADTAADAAREATQWFVDVIAPLEAPVVGFATGSSPRALYARLGALVSRGLDLTRVRGFALDEYVGHGPDSSASYRYFLEREVVGPLGLDPRRMRVPDGLAADLDAEAAAYEAAIRAAGGVDLQILGIGHNGHVGFNEPGSAADSRTRVVALAERTRIANSRYFSDLDSTPARALSQGIGTILEARHLLLLAAGADKAEIVRRALEGPVGEHVPASLLRGHPAVRVYLDRAAAVQLTDAPVGLAGARTP